ncbi:MAG: hypothetical protein ACXW07_02940 [Nitrososphaeraceae archaeon]
MYDFASFANYKIVSKTVEYPRLNANQSGQYTLDEYEIKERRISRKDPLS